VRWTFTFTLPRADIDKATKLAKLSAIAYHYQAQAQQTANMALPKRIIKETERLMAEP